MRPGNSNPPRIAAHDVDVDDAVNGTPSDISHLKDTSYSPGLTWGLL